MKKIGVLSFLALGIMSCSSYTEDQGKAAQDFCDCMAKETVGDFSIDFYECDLEVRANHDNLIFADEGYSLALDEKCPDIAAQITE